MSKKTPKDLGIKIGTELEAYWTGIKKKAEILIKESEDNLILQREILKLANIKIAIEEKDRKPKEVPKFVG